jgi:MFS family permease
MQFVRSQRLLLGAISLDMFSVFFGGAVALLPIYAQDILHVGADGLGMLRAADAVGSVCTMYILTRTGSFARPWRTLLIAVAGFGVTIIGFGLSTNFYVSLAWLVALGAFDAVSVVIRSTIIQTLTPAHMRGRVFSISSIFVASSNEIGSFESGFTARMMGTAPATIFGGFMTLGIVGAFSLMKTRELPTLAPSMAASVAEEEREKEPPVA